MRRALPLDINSDQIGVQENRFIGEYIKLLNNSLSSAREKTLGTRLSLSCKEIKKITGLLLFLTNPLKY